MLRSHLLSTSILGRKKYPAPLGAYLFAWCGDSRTDQMTYDTAQFQSETQNHINYANSISNFRYLGGEFALGGITTQTVLDTYLPRALASRPAYVGLFGGVNDFPAGTSAGTAGRIITAAERVRARNAVPIIFLEPGAENLTSQQCTDLHGAGGINDQWRAYGAAHPGKVIIIDWISTLLQSTNPVLFKTDYSVDGTHFDTPGAKAAGEFLHAQLSALIPDPGDAPMTGNFITNADFATATGGTVGAGNLGTLPSGCTSLGGTVGATSTSTSFAGTVMTVAGTLTGTFRVGQRITATGIATDVRIASLGTGTGGAGTYNLNITAGTLSARAVTTYDKFVTFSVNTRGDTNKEIVAVVEAASGITAGYVVQITTTLSGFTLTQGELVRGGCKVDIDAAYSGLQYTSTEIGFTYTVGFDIPYFTRSSGNKDIPSDGAKQYTCINTVYSMPTGKVLSSTAARTMKASILSGTVRFRKPWLRKMANTYDLT